MRSSVLASLLILACSSLAQPAFVVGEAHFFSRSDGLVAVVDTNRDGLIDEGFLLQMQEPPQGISEHFPSARLFFDDSQAVIIGEGTTVALVRQGGQTAPYRAGKQSTSYAGYGLVRLAAQSKLSVREPRCRPGQICIQDAIDGYEEFFPNYDAGSGDGGATPSCSSGGRGSYQCSIQTEHGSCSASCSTGYFACCNKGCYDTSVCPDGYQPTCRCISNSRL